MYKTDRATWGKEEHVQQAREDDLFSTLLFPSRVYHRRWSGCIMPGEMEEGGLETRMPVLGLTIGMAFLDRIAEGWWIFMEL